MDNEYDLIKQCREDGKSYAEISRLLKSLYPGKRGLEERTVRRFCNNRNIRGCLSNEELDRRVEAAVREVRDKH